MADLGVTLIKGDLDDPSSYAKGLEGAYASFVNANCESSFTRCSAGLRGAAGHRLVADGSLGGV